MVLHGPRVGGVSGPHSRRGASGRHPRRSVSGPRPWLLLLALLLAGCGGSGSRHREPRRPRVSQVAAIPVSRSAVSGSAVSRSAVSGSAVAERTHKRSAPQAAPQALVTAETENRLLVVDLRTGHVIRRVVLPADPENVAADAHGGDVVAVSSAAGKVTLLDRDSLRPIKALGGFDSPHIPAISPDEAHAYVTDDAGGTLTTIDLIDARVTSTIEVGAGAHHLSFDPMHQLAWVALGESARTIVTLSISDPAHPRVTGRFDPGFAVHDVSFSPDGRQVWLTAASGPSVLVFSATNRQRLFGVPVGPGPQHVVFAGPYAYVSTGYGGAIEKVDVATGRVLARTASPYGSFELDAADGYVVTSSLLRGTLAIYDPQLKLQRVVHLAPAARDVAISTPCAGDRPC